MKAGKRAQAEKEKTDEARKAYQKKSGGVKGGEGRKSAHTSVRPGEGDGNHPDPHPLHVEQHDDDDDEEHQGEPPPLDSEKIKYYSMSAR